MLGRATITLGIGPRSSFIMRSSNRKGSAANSVESLTGDVTRRLMLADQSVRRSDRSSTRTGEPRYSNFMLFDVTLR